MPDEVERSPDPVDEEQDKETEAPNEGSPGHHPDDGDARREDHESEHSFPASDPPANY